MGKKNQKIPQAPDPNQLISSQQQANTQNIVDLIGANRLNQDTPFGSISFEGGTGPGGVFGQTQKVTLAPDIQATLENQQGLAKILSGLGADAAGGINLNPVDFSGLPERVSSLDTSGLPSLPGATDQAAERQRIEQSLFDRSANLLRPEFDRQRERTDQTLADRGFDLQRSAGARDEFNRLDQAQNQSLERAAADAVQFGGNEMSRNFGMASQARGQGLAELLANAGLSNEGRQAGLNEQLLERNLPFQDIQTLSALTPDLPVLQPGGFFAPNNAAPDAIGAGLGAHNAALGNARLQQQQAASGLGGLTNIASAALPFILSDRRLKTDIKPLGEYRGLRLYSWRWNALAARLFGKRGQDGGFMAQDVQKRFPDAVITLPSGYLAIDYMTLKEAV